MWTPLLGLAKSLYIILFCALLFYCAVNVLRNMKSFRQEDCPIVRCASIATSKCLHGRLELHHFVRKNFEATRQTIVLKEDNFLKWFPLINTTLSNYWRR